MKLLILVSLMITCNVYCQNYRVEILGVDDGLNSSRVHSIIQSYDGKMWIGTRKGIDSYDANSFKTYQFESGTIKTINCLIESKLDSSIWAGSYEGLYTFDRKTGSNFFKKVELKDSINNIYIKSIVEDKSGSIWLATLYGLYNYNRQTKIIKKIAIPKINTSKISPEKVLFLKMDGKDNIWLGSEAYGIVCVSSTSESIIFQNKIIEYDKVNTLEVESDSVLWLATSDLGLVKYEINTDSKTFYNISNSKLPSNTILNLQKTADNTLLVGTDGGGFALFTINNSKFKIFNIENSKISNNKIYECLIDKQANIWLGHYMGGISILSPANSNLQARRYSDTSQVLLLPNVNDVLVGKDKTIWLANDEAGLLKIVNNKIVRVYKNELLANFEFGFESVVSLFQDKDENIWVGTYKGGVSRIDKKGTVLNLKNENQNKIIPANDIREITQDLNGDIWIATHGEVSQGSIWKIKILILLFLKIAKKNTGFCLIGVEILWLTA
ncbi:MAG: hypothetical protein IPO21_20575 [Bacteroidales bacterium]|nr:hypothetical protein [Bacteroidales bacterium]